MHQFLFDVHKNVPKSVILTIVFHYHVCFRNVFRRLYCNRDRFPIISLFPLDHIKSSKEPNKSINIELKPNRGLERLNVDKIVDEIYNYRHGEGLSQGEIIGAVNNFLDENDGNVQDDVQIVDDRQFNRPGTSSNLV